MMTVDSPTTAAITANVSERGITSIARKLRLPESEPLRLACNQLLAPISIAYETYGELNADKSNAILVCHALTGDQYVASQHPVTKKPGWWSTMIGRGKPIDTDHYFVICPTNSLMTRRKRGGIGLHLAVRKNKA